MQDPRTDAGAAAAKLAALRALLREMGETGRGVVIGYSGGVDSAFLAVVAAQELGERAVAVAAISESYAEREQQQAIALARGFGLNLRRVRTAELQNPDYARNPDNRCYFCKGELFAHLRAVADEQGIRWLAYGAIADDLADHRPGAQAAREHGARAPLQEVGLWKHEVRHLSRELGLPTWDKPSMACLSSRIPYGTPVEPGLLRRIEACENLLHDLGFRQVRVRHHDAVARIEIGREEFPLITAPGTAETVVARFRAEGYTFVALDLAGYRTGSMNTVPSAPVPPARVPPARA